MKLSANTKNRLDSLAARAKQMYDKKALNGDISELGDKAVDIIVADLSGDNRDSYLDNRIKAFKHASVQKIHQFAIKRMREQGNMTVGELIDHLSQFDKERVVKICCHVECMTDAGTDLGGMEDHRVSDIKDLETRVEISITRDW